MADQAGDLARSEMPLLDHLVELRTRLLWCVAWFVLAFAPCMFFASEIFAFLLWPFEQAAHGETDLQLIYTAPHEFFFTQIKLAMFAALFVAFPFIAFQLYRFIAPGLYRNERRAFYSHWVHPWFFSSLCRWRLSFSSRCSRPAAMVGRMCVWSIGSASICLLQWC